MWQTKKTIMQAMPSHTVGLEMVAKNPARIAAKIRAKQQAAIKDARKPDAVRHWFGDLGGV